MKYNQRTSVGIDPECDEELDYLRETLDSPKAWILRRLVHAEVVRLRKDKKIERTNVEVAAR